MNLTYNELFNQYLSEARTMGMDEDKAREYAKQQAREFCDLMRRVQEYLNK